MKYWTGADVRWLSEDAAKKVKPMPFEWHAFVTVVADGEMVHNVRV